ncbi:unnamed protein product, partial [Allacma fusca]
MDCASDEESPETANSADSALQEDLSSQSEKRPPRSKVHPHFKLQECGTKYKCNYCSKTLKKDSTGSTTSLRRHITTTHKSILLEDNGPPAKKSQMTLDSFAVPYLKDSGFYQRQFEELLVEYVIETNQPFNIVNSDVFVKFARFGRPQAQLPRNDKLKSLCMRRFQVHKDLVKKIHGSTGENCRSNRLLDKQKLSVVSCLALSLKKVLEDYSIADKLISITCDNASNCDKFVKEFQNMSNDQFSADQNCVRCLAHIVNLSCQASLSVLRTMRRRPVQQTDSDQDEDEERPDFSSQNSNESDSDESTSFDFDETTDEENFVTEAHSDFSVYYRLRKGIQTLRKSPLLRAKFRDACKVHKMKAKI